MKNNDLEIIERLDLSILQRVNTGKAILQRKTEKTKANNIRSYLSKLPIRYRSYIASANKRGIRFELTVEEFESICLHRCVYCGTNNKIGVDRIYSSDGYTIENTQPCCATCNWMKSSLNPDVFINHIKKIFNNLHTH
jgi:hypothetical protein